MFQFLWAYYRNFFVYCKICKIEDSIISALQSELSTAAICDQFSTSPIHDLRESPFNMTTGG